MKFGRDGLALKLWTGLEINLSCNNLGNFVYARANANGDWLMPTLDPKQFFRNLNVNLPVKERDLSRV